MQGKLKDKVALITGATSGMGKAIAETFAREGARCIVSGRDLKRGEQLANELSELSPTLFFQADVSKAEENKQLIKKAAQAFGRLDILSLNAGVLGLGTVSGTSVETWQHTIETNLNSIFYLCKYGLPELQKTGRGVVLINASIAAFKSFPQHAAYCASKAGAVALMKQMALDYGPEIRVNAICPGPVNTPLLHDSAQAFENPESIIAATEAKTLLKRLGEPEDVARLALFLASDEASWITGSAITIDGGILNSG
ncbi:SDR family NAD(P)-dependent oxidoreductase [Poritiphilus flavus]|uniref:Glucose 1-dehydrogenase n=1 Tax=Poritiphilus flavus TaxID=2697053 RepID=A0A6L9E8B5_9FLAO|nr:SDR family oxidoreductase [Poritiphilus flavus]NAS10699.1 glucose 1-dehydrogenase [Poritiphilus flavus]